MATSLETVLNSIPAWGIALTLFLVFLGISFGCRMLVVRRCNEERRDELADHAGKLVTGIAASFGFFVGFAITMSWGAVSASQTAVGNEAAAAQQLVWTLNNISDQQAAHAMLGDLQSYLLAVGNQDGPHLVQGDTANLPSAAPLDTLQQSIHAYAYGPDSQDAEASGLVDAAARLNAAAATVTAVPQRSLPLLVSVLLLVTGGLLAAITGISSASTHKPWLMAVWCLIPALAIAVIPGPGGIEVDLSPLLLVAKHIAGS